MKLKHILKTKDFRELVVTGEKNKGNLLGLYSKGNSKDEDLTVGVIISKKVAPRAVTRNYLKRIIYNFYTEKRKKIIAGTRIVVRVISPIEKKRKRKTAQRVLMELEDLTRQAKLTNE